MHHPDHHPQTGMLLIISGPSGVGKTTITRAVRDAFAGSVYSVSATTRPKTEQDREGIDYHFVSDAEFDRMIGEGAFLEWANVYGKKYGTLRRWVLDQLATGKLVILEIDVQGASNVKGQLHDAFCMYVLPPSEETLIQRLRARKRDPEEVIQRRFVEAVREMDRARTCGVYDVFLTNSDLQETTQQAIASVRAALAQRRPAE